MTKRHRGNRTLQDETAASSYIFTIPCNKRPGKTWMAFYRQRWMRLEVPGDGPGSGTGRSQNAPGVSTFRCAPTSAQTQRQSQMASAAAFGSPIVRGLSQLPAAVSVECSTWNTTDVESLVAKEGGGYVSRETLGTAEGRTVDQTQIAAGDLSRKIRRY